MILKTQQLELKVGDTAWFIPVANEVAARNPKTTQVFSATVTQICSCGGNVYAFDLVRDKTSWQKRADQVFASKKDAEQYLKFVIESGGLD